MGGQSISAHVNIPASAIALHIPAPLSLTFTQEKGTLPVKLKHKQVVSVYWGGLWKENYLHGLHYNHDSVHAPAYPDMCEV